MSGEVSYDVAILALKVACHHQPALTTALLAKVIGVDAERALAWTIVADAARV